MRTLEQRFASDVYEKVNAYAQAHPQDDPQRKRYGAMAQELPVLIHTAGLAQALAFVDAKATGANEKPYRQLLDDLAGVLEFADRAKLAEKSREVPTLAEYADLTRRALLALTWFKRFSQSILKVDATQGDMP